MLLLVTRKYQLEKSKKSKTYLTLSCQMYVSFICKSIPDSVGHIVFIYVANQAKFTT